MRKFHCFYLLACLRLLPVVYGERMNIVLVTGDDMGQELAAYGRGQVPTPALDALARESLVFDRAYVTQSSCSPSRSSMFTGMYPHENGQIGLAHRGFHLVEGLELLPNLLRDAGYRTGIIGKLHVYPEEPFGFDMLLHHEAWDHSTREVDRVADTARNWILQGGEQPFFLKISLLDPHRIWITRVNGLPTAPIDDTTDARIQYDPDRDPAKVLEESVGYFNNLMRMDAGVGRILDVLRETGTLDRTLFIFMGDNGPPVWGAKATNSEAGTLVPLMVRAPGEEGPRGARSPALVSGADLFPTILRAAGVAVPEQNRGRPLQEVFDGVPAHWRTHLFTEMNFHAPGSFRPARAVRGQRFKYQLAYTEEGESEAGLYDLVQDPWETRNLMGLPAYASVAGELADALRAWRERTGDPLLDPAVVRDLYRRAAEWKAEHENMIPEGDPFYSDWKRFRESAGSSSTETPHPVESSTP